MNDMLCDNHGHKIVYYISEQDIYDFLVSELKIKPEQIEVEEVAEKLLGGINHKQIIMDAVLRYIANE